MLNYANLNDVEFEYLCQDIMSKKLGIDLRRFAPGRDGGIDLVDSVTNKNIIVQVKHYSKTNASGLISSLKNEVRKVEEHKPKHYYVCCSMELSAARIDEIYSLFVDYMTSDANILTLIEIDDFLTLPENIEILRKHYKLWISNSNILQEISNHNIFIDCEYLMSSIQSDERYFVQTSAYDSALKYLTQHKTLLITGDPGVGKTITSKMLILHFASEGYRVRYTTDGADLSDLKKAISLDRDAKEVILLDDCFGQAYFNMKETQGNELLSLIKHVYLSKNKILILNSRVTIYREARVRTLEIVKSFENKEFNIQVIDMNALSGIEKARIFYNHLYFNEVNCEYFASIKENKNYLRIINHANYNPRIVEYVTSPIRYSQVSPKDYFNFILGHLNNPDKVWADEYERKLTKVDRILLTTLFSLTDTVIPLNHAKQCFNARLNGLPDVDLTIDQFRNSLKRLQGAFVKIVDMRNKKMLSMMNPSINDYLTSRITSNEAEKVDIINTAICVMQLKKMMSPSEYKLKLQSLFHDTKILDYEFFNSQDQSAFITYYISHNNVLDMRYQSHINSFLANIHDVDIYEKQAVSAYKIFSSLLNSEAYSFYQIDTLLLDARILKEIFSYFNLEELINIIDDCFVMYQDYDEFLLLCQSSIKEAIDIFCSNVNADEFDIDVQEFIDDSPETVMVKYSDGDYAFEPDIDALIVHIESAIKEILKSEINDMLKYLPHELKLPVNFFESVHIKIIGASDLVMSHLETDLYDDDRHDRMPQMGASEIDLIFDR